MNCNICLVVFLLLLILTSCKKKSIHPNAIINNEQLDFVKSKIDIKADPWYSAFKKVQGISKSGANALKTIDSNSHDSYISKIDAQKAYANALTWYLTEDDIYAQQAIDILNAWSHLQGFTGGNDQDKLQAGWIGCLFASAAEIMRTNSDWKPNDVVKFQSMFVRAFYPQLNEASSWNGNVDLTQIEAILSIAVFNDDQVEFELGIERFKERIPSYFYQISDGRRPRSIHGDGGNVEKFWSNPEKWIDGLTQESCRDNGHHAQYGLASAVHSAEIAWHQGIDLYTPNTKRLTDAMELLALQISSGKMQNICKENNTTNTVFNTWEMGYNHYHFRKGLSLPNTARVIKEKVRLESKSDWNIFHETLTHASTEVLNPF